MTVRINVELSFPRGRNPFTQGFSKRRALNEFAAKLHALAGGNGGGTTERATLRVSTGESTGTVTCASVQAADSVTLNGQAIVAQQAYATGTVTPTVTGIDVDDILTIDDVVLTAKRHHSTGTVTCTAAGIDVDDTVTLNGGILTAKKHHSTGTVTIVIANTDVDDTVTLAGVAFTAKNAENTAAAQFNISGTATAAATSLAACINASVDVAIVGILTATSAAGVVTVRAVATGVATSTLVSSDADGLAVSGAGSTTAGTVPGAGEFDISGSDTQTAVSLAAAINDSEDVLIDGLVTATSATNVVTIRKVATGTGVYTLVSSDAQLACSGSGNLTAGSVPAADQFDISGTNAQCVTSIESAILGNADLAAIVTVSTSSTVVSLRSIIPGSAGNYVLTSSDAQIAVSGSGTMTGGAALANNKFCFTGTDAQVATELARAINATTTDIVELQTVAEADGAVVTITGEEAGPAGNAVTLASNDAGRLLTSGTRLTGGTQTEYTF